MWQWSNQNYKEDLNNVPGVGPVNYTFGLPPAGVTNVPLVPASLTEYASPLNFTARSWVEALYVQDQWTLKRLTLNLGLRYDWERGYAPAQTVPTQDFHAGARFPARRRHSGLERHDPAWERHTACLAARRLLRDHRPLCSGRLLHNRDRKYARECDCDQFDPDLDYDPCGNRGLGSDFQLHAKLCPDQRCCQW